MRQWLHRFNQHGVDGLGDRPRPDRPRRLGEVERGQLINLVRQDPPGRLTRQPDGTLAADDEQRAAQWTLDALVKPRTSWACRSSAVRCVASWWTRGTLAAPTLVDQQHRPGVRPKRAQVIALYTQPPAGMTVVCADELGPVIPRTFPPPPGWSTNGHRIKAPLEYGRGLEKTWVYGGLRVADGQ